MPRPCKPRQIGSTPPAAVYKPAGVPVTELAWVEMTHDEYEALCLVDGDGLDQEQVAHLMGVSRPTVSRILARGRGKIAQMLANGAALVIEGGVVSPREDGRQARHGRGCRCRQCRGGGQGGQGGRSGHNK